MPSYRPASLTERELQSLQDLEEMLGPDIFLVAVEQREESFALEAKADDGSWRPLDEVFTNLPCKKLLFRTREEATEAKGKLKNFLRSHASHARSPIRIHRLAWPAEPKAEVRQE